MARSHGAVSPNTDVLDSVIQAIPDDLPADRRALLEPFTKMYLKRLAASEIPDLTTDQLLAEISDLLGYFDARSGGEPAIRVFTPHEEDCGYTTPGSVVQVVSDDSPFLVDSVAGAVARSGALVVRHLHPIMGTVRDDSGGLTEIGSARGAVTRESVQHFELDRALPKEAIASLEADIADVLGDISAVVGDFAPMREEIRTMIGVAKKSVHHYSFEEISETVEFLDWLLDDNFVFLGYREYRVADDGDGLLVEAVPGTGLGILSGNGAEPRLIPFKDLPAHLADRYRGGDLLVITKTNRHATVHRDARMDYVGIRHIDSDGVMVAELRMLGLFTSKAYLTPAGEIPVLKRKLQQVLELQDVMEGSYDYKSIIQLFETFPKDDLFGTAVEALSETLGELVETEENQSIRVFVRRDLLDRAVSVLVTIPRDRFNAELRKQLQALFLERFGGLSIDYRLALGESGDARIHFSVWTAEGATLDIDVLELEREVVALARNWDDRVFDELNATTSETVARRLCDTWTPQFPAYYKASTSISLVAGDILALDSLMASGEDLLVGLQNETGTGQAPTEHDRLTRITVYRNSGKLNLSMMMPLLEHLGLIVVEEVPTRLKNDIGTFIHDFGVLDASGEQLAIGEVGERIAAGIRAVFAGTAESDSLQRLLVSSGLTHDELTILRAYRSYWHLVTPAFSKGYIDDAFASHPGIGEAIVRLFDARFGTDQDPAVGDEIADEIVSYLDEVSSLDEDRILRGFLGLVLATERTNVLVPGRESLSLKFSSALVPDIPAPTPLYEVFVYAPSIEGVHLRGGMVARGGLRWSDRREDYRTEVLGLMKAQMTKNAVIVPTGAKGGFVIKESVDPSRPTYDEVKAGYEVFIAGLLNVTDNRVGSDVVPPKDVFRHDGDDPYLVVAADKGTASFSDTANELAREDGFWLDDAFASGGSAGYDHKALGITARGAWESVRRHFIDLGVDADSEEITVVGIGDMSGDVFGNGMLLSRNLKLIAAFDHRDIFIDPDPDPATSWEERDRLFNLPRSSWVDYNPVLISRGGGVFSRSAKSIELTPEIREALGATDTRLTPSELIRKVLTAPVDLLWNGGIGTYVKARGESSEGVQDRSNDAVRVNGRDLRARVVGEGGNLGLTQLGRIEFEHNGGHVFTDFIDNSGGVHCSDREVNLKILLGMVESSGKINRQERDRLIESVSDDVVEAILYDNFLQAQIISQRSETSARFIEAYSDLMDRLERDDILNREIEFLPSSEQMQQRAREGAGMARPELAVLLAYAKRSLTDLLLSSTLPDDPHFEADLFAYFPPTIAERFADEIREHPLRRELISTIVANQVLNSQGSTYYSRMRTLTGATAASIVRAYKIARLVTDAERLWADIEDLNGRVDASTARAMLKDVDGLVTRVSRWYLNNPSEITIDEAVERDRDDFATLALDLPKIRSESWRAPYEAVVEDFVGKGVPVELATRHAFQRALRRGPDIVNLAHESDRPVAEIAALYTKSSNIFRIGWLERQIRLLPGPTPFDRLAIESLREDLLGLRHDIVAAVLSEADGSIDEYLEIHDRALPRLERWYQWLSREGILEIAAAVIAVRRLRQVLLGN